MGTNPFYIRLLHRNSGETQSGSLRHQTSSFPDTGERVTGGGPVFFLAFKQGLSVMQGAPTGRDRTVFGPRWSPGSPTPPTSGRLVAEITVSSLSQPEALMLVPSRTDPWPGPSPGVFSPHSLASSPGLDICGAGQGGPGAGVQSSCAGAPSRAEVRPPAGIAVHILGGVGTGSCGCWVILKGAPRDLSGRFSRAC